MPERALADMRTERRISVLAESLTSAWTEEGHVQGQVQAKAAEVRLTGMGWPP